MKKYSVYSLLALGVVALSGCQGRRSTVRRLAQSMVTSLSKEPIR